MSDSEQATSVNNEVVEESPSVRLQNALKQYCHELEALHNSLGQTMALFGVLAEKSDEEIRGLIEKYGTNIKEEGSSTSFVLPMEKKNLFDKMFKNQMSARSAQRLMPRNTIVAYICTYDAFLGKVLRYILTVNPAMLDDCEKPLTYSQLKKFESLEDAREFIIEREIDTVMRKSHRDHFSYLTEKLGIPFTKGLNSWPDFVELTERRNLFVHCDGVVSNQYISNCRSNGCELPKNIKPGDRLGVSDKYVFNSFNKLYEIGIKLAHVIWRKIQPDEISIIGGNLSNHTFELICNEHYEPAISILEFFVDDKIKHHDNTHKMMHIVNLAQCYKWNGQFEKCTNLLNRHDWSACEDKFKLANAVLREDWDGVRKYMKRLSFDDEFNRVFYKDWPLFKSLRNHEDFKEWYKEIYEEDFVVSEIMMADEDEQSGKE